jgi:hypothetical protein
MVLAVQASPEHASSLRRLSLFLVANYAVGYAIGSLVTGSVIIGIAAALLAPGITMLAIAVAGLARS